MTDIVERLRASTDPVRHEAAAEITRLRELSEMKTVEIERLRESCIKIALDKDVMIERHMREKVALAGLVAKERDEVERLRFAALAVDEVNARLHAALQNIAIGGNGETNWTASEMRAYAEDALRPT